MLRACRVAATRSMAASGARGTSCGVRPVTGRGGPAGLGPARRSAREEDGRSTRRLRRARTPRGKSGGSPRRGHAGPGHRLARSPASLSPAVDRGVKHTHSSARHALNRANSVPAPQITVTTLLRRGPGGRCGTGARDAGLRHGHARRIAGGRNVVGRAQPMSLEPSPAPQPRPARFERRKAVIVRAAVDVINRKGVRGMTLADRGCSAGARADRGELLLPPERGSGPPPASSRRSTITTRSWTGPIWNRPRRRACVASCTTLPTTWRRWTQAGRSRW